MKKCIERLILFSVWFEFMHGRIITTKSNAKPTIESVKMNAMSAIFMHGLPEDKTEIKLNGLNTARALIQRENNKG